MSDLRLRMWGAWTLRLLVTAGAAIGFVALLLLLGALLTSVARAQDTADPVGVTLSFPTGITADSLKGTVTYSPSVVDSIVRTQSIKYLESVVRSKYPKPQDFSVGKVEGGPGPSAIPIYVAGRVVEAATKVQIRVDNKEPYHEAVLRPTMPGFPKVWTWTVPEIYHDGKPHKIYARALRASGGVIGPIDNATYSKQWSFTIGAAPVGPPPTTQEPAPAFVGKFENCDTTSPTYVVSGTSRGTVVNIYATGTPKYWAVPVVNGRFELKVSRELTPEIADGRTVFLSGVAWDGPTPLGAIEGSGGFRLEYR